VEALTEGTRVWIVWGASKVTNGRLERKEFTNGRATVDRDCPSDASTVEIWFGGCDELADIRTLPRKDVCRSLEDAEAELARRCEAQRVSELEAAVDLLQCAGYSVVVPVPVQLT
jgi:hypothetical protein